MADRHRLHIAGVTDKESKPIIERPWLLWNDVRAGWCLAPFGSGWTHRIEKAGRFTDEQAAEFDTPNITVVSIRGTR